MMTKPARTVAPNDLELEQLPTPLHGVLVYEDFTTGLRAKTVFDHLRSQLDAGVDPRVDLWRFDLLNSPDVCRQAAQEAADADLVLLSGHGGVELPAGVKAWLHDWLRLRWSQPCALVLSLDLSVEAPADPAQPLVYLRTLAKQAGLDLFPHFGEVPRPSSTLDREPLARRASYVSTTLEGILHRHDTPPRWGINE